MLTVERLSSHEDFAALRKEWALLDQSLSPRTPFTGPLWHELWWVYLRRQSLLARDEFLACGLRDGVGRLVGVAPLMRTHRPSLGFLRLSEIQFFGADPNVTELRGPICRPEDQAEVLRALSDYFANNDTKWNWIRWQGIRRDMLAHSYAPDESPRFRWSRELPTYILDLPTTWPIFERSLTRRVRKKLRACYKSLERDSHVMDFRVIQNREDLPESLDLFYALHKARTRVRYFDVFSDPRARAFFNQYASAMAARNELRIFQLAFNGVVVAVRLGFKFDRELYLYHSGNDPTWDKYSIMTTLLAEIMKWAIGQGVQVLNLSTGKDRAKTRWQPAEIVYSEGIEVAPGLVGGQISRLYEFLRDQTQSGSPVRKLTSWLRSSVHMSTPQPDATAGAGETD